MKNKKFSDAGMAQFAILLASVCALQPAAWAAMTEPFVRYTVQPKDTLQGLTRTLLQQPAQWPQVAKLNGLKNANRIYPGQIIDVPKSLINLSSQPRIALSGKVISVEGDVKIGGQAAQVGAAVPEGARLQTGPNSSAVVQLADGSRMQLMPKTLAEITRQHGYALRDPSSSASTTWFSGAIRLVEGVLDTLAEKKANRVTPLEVTTPTSIVGVRGTQFRVAFEDPASGTARTEVIEGKVRSDNSAQKVGAEVGGGFGAAFKPTDREVKVVPLLPALPLAQLPAQVVRSAAAATSAASATNPANVPVAAWTVGTLAGAAGYRAQFATDENFAQIRGDFKSTSPAINVSALSNGSYYARVRGIDPAGIEGFDAIKLVEIKSNLVWPVEIAIGAAASYTPEGLVLKVYGQSPDKPQQLIVQVARDAAFTQGVQTVPLAADATALLTNIPVGQRSYVRFTSTTPGQEGASATFAMDVPGNWGTTVLGLTQALQPLR
jgi:hypothetical protein